MPMVDRGALQVDGRWAKRFEVETSIRGKQSSQETTLEQCIVVELIDPSE